MRQGEIYIWAQFGIGFNCYIDVYIRLPCICMYYYSVLNSWVEQGKKEKGRGGRKILTNSNVMELWLICKWIPNGITLPLICIALKTKKKRGGGGWGQRAICQSEQLICLQGLGWEQIFSGALSIKHTGYGFWARCCLSFPAGSHWRKGPPGCAKREVRVG